VREVGVVTGCLCLVAAEDWAALGGFSARYFLYSEDTDLSFRVARMGMRPVITPDATVVHHAGASGGGVTKAVRLMQGKVTYVQANWAGWRRSTGVGLLVVGAGLRAAAQGARSFVRKGGAQDLGRWQEVWQRRTEWERGYPVEPQLQQAARA
jgi:hypothetical protein